MMINLTKLFVTEDIAMKQVAFFHYCLFKIIPLHYFIYGQVSREMGVLQAGRVTCLEDRVTSAAAWETVRDLSILTSKTGFLSRHIRKYTLYPVPCI